MTLHDKISALPGWPERIAADVQPWQTIVHEHRAALARLAVAREWIEANDRPCSREEILAALEGPK